MKLIAFIHIVFGMIVVSLIGNLFRRSKMNGRGADATKNEALATLICFVGYVITGFGNAFYILAS